MIIEKEFQTESHYLREVRKAFFEEKGLELIIKYMSENLSESPDFDERLKSYQEDYKVKRKNREDSAIGFIKKHTGVDNVVCYSIDFNESKVTFKYEAKES